MQQPFLFDDSYLVLQKDVPLSQSVLWKMQSDAYRQLGPAAWTEVGVPSYLTSSPSCASRYAQLAFSYLRDLFAQGELDMSEPVYLIDLGAGTGRFGYLFLKEFLPLVDRFFKGRLSPRYVMADIAEANTAFCQGHPSLKKYREEKVLDFVYYSSEEPPDALFLMEAQVPLQTKNPLILIANYFFDTIPQDLFRIKEGVLEEGIATVAVKRVKEIEGKEPTDPALAPYLEARYSYRSIANPDTHYPNPLLNRVLAEYRSLLGQGTFVFPLRACQTIDYFVRLSAGRLCLLAADQGIGNLRQAREAQEPKLALHGTRSIAVNYPILQRYFACGGEGWLPSLPASEFIVFVGVWSGKVSSFFDLPQSFQREIDRFEPKDYWELFNWMQKAQPFELGYFLKFLKLGRWDPADLYVFFDKVRKLAPRASAQEKEELAFAIDHIYRNFYPLTAQEGEFILNLGTLLYDIGEYRDAAGYFKQSMEITGPSPLALRNLAICYNALKEHTQAFAYLKQAKELELDARAST